jgi:Kef-type K+ transport system membrane component KefB
MEIYAIFLCTIGVSLLLAKFLGGLFEKAKIPAVLGEILAGIILGTLVLFFPSIKSVIDPNIVEFDFISRIGILFLLFLAGLQTDLKTLKSTGKTAIISTIGGVFVPLILGFFIIQTFGFNEKEAFGIGVMLTATSIGITVRVMMDLGVMGSKVGIASLIASVIDDFIGISLVVLATGTGDLGQIILSMILFIIVTLVIGYYTVDPILKFLKKLLPTTQSLLAFTIGMMFLFSALAEYAFQAAIEGAFILGLIIRLDQKELINSVKTITYGFIGPLFFIRVGSILDIRVFAQVNVLLFAFTIVGIAIIGKVTGRGIFAKISGFSWKESFQMGVGSIPRMEVALISLTVVINAGILTPEHVQIAIAAAMVFITTTTLITPSLLKFTFRHEIQNLDEIKDSKKADQAPTEPLK